MSVVEKLLVEILERKKRIISSAKAQTEEFDRYLVSKCILQGTIPPPPFLLFPPPPKSKDEELISGVLLPRPRYTNQYLDSCNLQHRGRDPDVQNQRGREEGSTSDVSALDRSVALAATDRLSVSPQLPTTGDAQCVLNIVPEVDSAVGSPQGSRNVALFESCSKQPQSLVKIERSKSRQRALEIRKSAKAAKTHCRENCVVSTQPDYAFQPWSVKHVEMSNEMCVEEGDNRGEGMVKECSGDRITRSEDFAQRVSGFQDEPENVCNSLNNASEADKGQIIGGRVVRSGHHHELLNDVDSTMMACVSSASEEPSGDGCIKKTRITRSRTSGLRPSSGKEISNEDRSCYVAEDVKRPTHLTDGSAQLPKDVSQSGESAKPVSVMSSGSKGSRKNIGVKRSIKREDDCYVERIKRSRSSVQQPVSANECFKLDSSGDYGKENAVGRLEQQSNQVDDSGNDIRPADMSRSVLKGHEGESNANHGEVVRSSRSSERRSCETQLLNTDSPSFVENHGSEMSGQPLTELVQPPPADLVDKRVDLTGVLGIHPQPLPTSQGSYTAEPGKCVVIEASSKVDLGRPFENGLASGSNPHGVDLVTEILDSRSPGENAIYIKSIQLNFDGVEEDSMVEMCEPVDHSLAMVCEEQLTSTMLSSKNTLVEEPPVDHLEMSNKCIELAQLEKQNIFIEEEKLEQKSSETKVEGCGTPLNESAIKSDQLEFASSFSGNQNPDTHLTGLWPQLREIETTENFKTSQVGSLVLMTEPFQLTSAVPVKDAANLNIANSKSPDKCMHQNMEHYSAGAETSSPKVQHEVGPHTEVVGQSATADPMGMHEQIPALSGSRSPSKVPLGCVEDAKLTDLTSSIQVEGEQQAINETQGSLQSASRLEIRNAELLTSDKEEILDETKSELTFDELTLHTKSVDIGNHKFVHVSTVSQCCQPSEMTAADQTMPNFEGFVTETDDEQSSLCTEGINFSKLDLPSNLLERAIVIERLCKSACMHTPISKSPTANKLQQELKLYQSMPNGLLEAMELWNGGSPGKQMDAGYNSMAKEIDCSFHEKTFSDCQPSSSAQSARDIRKPCTSPVRKIWDGIILKPSSLEKRTSSIPELPCISEENENADEATDVFDGVQACNEINKSVESDALADLTRNSNLPISVRENGVLDDNSSVDLMKKNSVICSNTKGKLRNTGRKGRCTSVEKENQSMSVGVSDSKRANDSLMHRVSRQKLSAKSSLRNGVPSLVGRESKRNNIVSNITSFIPLVQQKQAPSANAGKREVKVKALEAAEAAKRQAEKKENERKMKKEALKQERARMEEKISRKLEAEREKKEEERKKKEADMAARKRQREEEEKKKERKRKCVEKPKKPQDERSSVQKHSKDISRKHEKMGKTKGENSLPQVLECEPTCSKISINDTSKGSIHFEANDTSNNYETKATSDLSEGANLSRLTSNIDEEPSYEISPYKGSDDEDEEDDDDNKQNFKFVPSWASKSNLALIIASQNMDPEQIFPPASFCSTAEVLMPRRLQQK